MDEECAGVALKLKSILKHNAFNDYTIHGETSGPNRLTNKFQRILWKPKFSFNVEIKFSTELPKAVDVVDD